MKTDNVNTITDDNNRTRNVGTTTMTNAISHDTGCGISPVRRFAFACVAVFVIAGAAACEHTKSAQAIFPETQVIAPPRAIDRPARQRMRELGRMVRAYQEDPTQDFIIEVELIANDTGISKEQPSDAGYYACQVFGDIGHPFRTSRTYGSVATLDRPAANGLAFAPRPANPTPRLKLRGNYLRCGERVITAREARALGLAKIGSDTLDLEIGGDERVTLTSVRLGLMLVAPDGASLPGPTATYESIITKVERSVNGSAFFAGSGGGASSNVQTSNDTADALYDLTATALTQILGDALLIPVHRIDPSIPEAGKRIERNFRGSLAQSSLAAAQATLKRLLFVSGRSMNMSSPLLGSEDRNVIAAEMKRSGLSIDRHQDVVEFAVRLWRTLDYNAAAPRIERYNDQRQHEAREQAMAARVAQTQLAAKVAAESKRKLDAIEERPALFGFPPGTPMILLDLHLLTVEEMQAVLQVVANAPDCQQIAVDATKRICGVKYAGRPADLQRALRRSAGLRGLGFGWSDGDHTLTVRSRGG